MIRTIASILLIALGVASTAAAQDGDSTRDFAGDRYLAGGTPASTTPLTGDLFAAGERVGVEADVGGSAHLAARRIALAAPVGDDLYAAGMDIRLSAPVAGGATLAGYDIEVAGAVGGNLRAAARHLRIAGEVGGSALVVAGAVELAGRVAGDADVTAETISFAPDARVEGTLTLRGLTEAEAAVPSGVAGAVRYVPLPLDREGPGPRMELPGLGEIVMAALVAFVNGVLVVAALALAAASLAPIRVEEAVERSVFQPGLTLWGGILTLALILGGALVLALTGIGALALPLILFAAFVLAAAGYVLGAYAVGARILRDTAQGAPDRFGPRLGAALIGAAVVALLGLVPFLGWLITLGVALFGLGAMLPSRARIGAAPM